MAYNVEKLAKLKHVQSVANSAKADVTALETRINAKMSSVYKVKGTLASSGLLATLLVAANEGNVYNISDSFTTTADFVEGAGKVHSAGTNVVIVNAGTSETPSYKFDVFAGDLSGLQTLVANSTPGNLAGLDANGQSVNSGIPSADVVTKVTGATENNIVVFDANGKIKNTGLAVATDEEFAEMLAEIYGN